MPENVNKAEVSGNLTKDVEVKAAGANKTPFARFTIASSRFFHKRDGGAGEETAFVSCVAWGDLAKKLQGATKGSRAHVVGRIVTGSYEKNGQKVYTTEVVADSVEWTAKA